MVFRNSIFNLMRAGSSFRRIILVLSIIGFFCFLSLLSFSSSDSYDYSPKFQKEALVNPPPPTTTEEEEGVALATLDSRIDAVQLNKPPKTPLTLADELLEVEEDVNQETTAVILQECPSMEENSLLRGRVSQKILRNENLQEDEVAEAHVEIQPGGHWKPEHCQSKYKVAIIIPYRDRHSHLVRLLNFLYPILERQLLDFRFIVSEQKGTDLFNKGRIMNAAFHFAEELEVDCVIFHDVDMFPQDDRVPYDCPGKNPRHVGAYVSNLGYKLWYNELVGGVLAMTMEQYRSVNGYSNLYWGWGGEDDDMGKRLLSQNYTPERPNQSIARFSMLKHKKRKHESRTVIHKLLGTTESRWKEDGVNQTSNWNVTEVNVKPLYYHLIVDVGKPPQEWRPKK